MSPDITTSTTNSNLTVSANGTGDVVVSGDADTNLQVTFGVAPGVDMAAITNTGFGTSTDTVDGVSIDFTNAGSGAITNAGLHVLVTSNNTNASSNLYGIEIEDLSSGGENANEIALRIGIGWDQGIVIESGGSTNQGLVYSGAGRPTKTITLSPEYAGAVLTASNSATTNGSMTSDASHSAEFRTYYQWASTQTQIQDYTVAVRVKLPKDFDSWATGTTMQINYQNASAVSATNALDVYIYNPGDSASLPVYFSTGNVSSSWTTINLTSSQLDNDASPDWDAADESVIIYLKMKASGTVNETRIGDIVINYLAKF